LGVKKGDRVVLDMQNCPQLLIAHFAILRANGLEPSDVFEAKIFLTHPRRDFRGFARAGAD